MRSTTLASFLVVFLSFPVMAQDSLNAHYNRVLGRAMQQLHREHPKEALDLFDQVLPHILWGLHARTVATETALSIGDTARAIGYLRQLYRYGGETTMHYSTPIKGLLAKGFWEPHLGELLHAREEWAMDADSLAIQSLLAIDELLRLDINVDPRAKGKQERALDQLLALSRQRGFPVPARVGSSFSIMRSFFWNLSPELAEDPRTLKLVALAEKAMAAGEIAPDFLCNFHDSIDLQAGRPMRYGSWGLALDPEQEAPLLQRLDLLDRNRASVGLPPYMQWVEESGMDPSKLRFAVE
ncbi:MAG TPA: hypothetical protein VGE21_03985 [Flavobacteriales bacterium]